VERALCCLRMTCRIREMACDEFMMLGSLSGGVGQLLSRVMGKTRANLACNNRTGSRMFGHPTTANERFTTKNLCPVWLRIYDWQSHKQS
jgi:hypothetical protein